MKLYTEHMIICRVFANCIKGFTGFYCGVFDCLKGFLGHVDGIVAELALC